MTALELAEALEGKREGREWRCRCPIHGGKSLGIGEQEGKLLVTCRAGCSQAEVITALKKMGLWGGVSDCKPSLPEPQNDTDKMIRKVDAIWRGSVSITKGDSVYRYLSNRGITLDTWPEDLHTHPALAYWAQDDAGKWILTGTFPAMLAVLRNR